ncbi:MAG: LamG-like jellyroll fold domain-containing protein [Patescibacteria group bacterium]|nr:LamG-like jellyroll fold domain-containing protein [Patescibacteria group bacterium]
MRLSSNASQLQLRLWDGSSSFASLYSSAGALAAGEWQHITLVADGLTTAGNHTVSVSYYRNGELLNTATASINRQVADDSTGFTIGNAMWDSSLMAQYGAVTLFDSALTADQVEHHYLSTIPEPSTLAMLGLLAGLGLCSRRRTRI